MQTSAATGTPRIEVIDLVKTYKREGGASITPVNHVTLTVAANELVVLLGPSGCGKTTLLRCVAGLERPDEGEIIIDGKTVFSSKKGIYEPSDRRQLAMVFQSYALWPHMNVADNVAYPLHSRKIAKEQIATRVSEVLGMVGVGGLEHQYPGRISGGQQQRVALARALVANSSVVLFDEPLSNVDAQVRAQLRFELQAMQRRLGFSGLYVTHDQTEAMELGHRVAVLDSGVISALGTPFEVYNNPPNEYVASFVGVANLWRGKITALDDKNATVSTALGAVMSTRAAVMGEGLQVGDAVSVVARPEKLRLTPEKPADAVNAFAVAIDATLFSGAHTEVVAVAGEQRVTVWMHDYEAVTQLPRGRPAWLSVAPGNVRVVPAAKGGAA
jgi:ABC-type Fe3+/spermidine/putrescine transport system ATPase subunit